MNTEDQLEEEQGICLHARRGKATNTNSTPKQIQQTEGGMDGGTDIDEERGEEEKGDRRGEDLTISHQE